MSPSGISAKKSSVMEARRSLLIMANIGSAIDIVEGKHVAFSLDEHPDHGLLPESDG